jgi:hypothetical protein
MPTPKIFIVVSFVPYRLWAGINLVPVTHRDTTGDGRSCDTWSTVSKGASDY